MELDEHLNFDIRDGIGWLTLDRPAAKNAMTKSIYAGIRDVCRRVRTDEEIQVLVIQGTSGAFTVGGDLKEVLEMLREGDAAGVVAYGDYLPFEALRSLPKPTIASINGLCMGGGLTLALMCDIRIATSQSRFAIPEAKVGIVDAHLPRLLRERVPAARLRYWLYTGATFSAKRGLRRRHPDHGGGVGRGRQCPLPDPAGAAKQLAAGYRAPQVHPHRDLDAAGNERCQHNAARRRRAEAHRGVR